MRWSVLLIAGTIVTGAHAQERARPAEAARGLDLRRPVLLNRTLNVSVAGVSRSARFAILPGPSLQVKDAILSGDSLQVTVANRGTEPSAATALEAYLTYPPAPAGSGGSGPASQALGAADNVDRFGLYLSSFNVGPVPALQPGASQSFTFHWSGFGTIALCGKGTTTKCVPPGSDTPVVVLKLH